MQDHVEAIAYLASLLQDATTRTLTIREIKILTQVSKDLPLLLYQLPLQLEQIHLLVDRNQMLAMEVVPVLLMGPLAERYWDALVQHTVSTNTLEVIHHCLITRSVPVQRELIHLTVDLAIITCTEADYTHEEKYVRTFLKFIQSLHDHQLVDYANHVPGLQSFCIQFLHIRGVSALYKTISNIQVQE
ncbi:hypothetical protein DM01DRAFT_1178345 [Hesseltinella vesiculosa]|uniref:CCR4-NOT transcription complex subunit 11 n=1 Tax=Hesseltinella vesiculosa TaxID=101127 RepID=A0A1X2G4G7_9FUNG|nr:hypothetical protein DM01DRAFT_1178345 [Hesseltinella vesiculosa]